MMDRPLKILVVEDEMIIGAKVSLFLTELGYEVTGMIPRAEEALLHVEENAPDMALLDIQLKGSMDGIALAQILQETHQIPVIFLTANADDATFHRAKETKPYAFLAKPFKKSDLKRAVELATGLIASQPLPAPQTQATEDPSPYVLADRIFVRHKDKMVKILLESILYIEAERNYCRIVTPTREFLLTMPMKSLEEKLPANQFQRIHRSHIVNLRHVDEVGENTVTLGETELVLSKSFRREFLTRIQSI